MWGSEGCNLYSRLIEDLELSRDGEESRTGGRTLDYPTNGM